MARIRSLKPEWLESEDLLECSDQARMLSAAVLLLADDWGNVKANPKLLGSKVWPWDGNDGWWKADAATKELEACGYLRRYGGGRYLHITGFFRHQKVDKIGRPRHPLPSFAIQGLPDRWSKALDGLDAESYEIADDSGTTREESARAREYSASVRRGLATEIGDRIIGDRKEEIGSDARGVASVEVGGAEEPPPPGGDPSLSISEVRSHFDQVYPNHTESQVDGTGQRDAIRRALRKGMTVQDICDAIDGSERDKWTQDRKRTGLQQILKSSKLAQFVEVGRELRSTGPPPEDMTDEELDAWITSDPYEEIDANGA